MEELDIKKIWHAGDQVPVAYSDEKIQYIIDQAPQNIIASFVKMLKTEKWANLTILSGAVLGLLYFGFWGYGLLTLAINILFFAYYRQLIYQLDKEYVDQNVVEYLNDVHTIICKFTRHFKITLVVITLISFSIGFFVGTERHATINELIESLVGAEWLIIISAIVFALVVSFLGFYHMYGKKAKRIKQMLSALNEEETD